MPMIRQYIDDAQGRTLQCHLNSDGNPVIVIHNDPHGSKASEDFAVFLFESEKDVQWLITELSKIAKEHEF